MRLVRLDRSALCVGAHAAFYSRPLASRTPADVFGQMAGAEIVFNGEIYNYRELRSELGAWSREQGEGTREAEKPTSDLGPLTSDLWHSNTDTEVILRAYARWGIDCLQRLRGMFAFAIYDQGLGTGDRGGALILARDPFGIKPLYYYQTDRLFLFASEVRALLASGLVPRKLSRDGLLLIFNSAPFKIRSR